MEKMHSRDPVLVSLVQEQTNSFNRNDPVEKKEALLKKIQKRQKELKE
jgi:hypothetical protein